MICSTILKPGMSGRRLRTMPRTAPASMSLKASTRNLSSAMTVATKMPIATGSGSAAGGESNQ
jgi:hypothetical protein